MLRTLALLVTLCSVVAAGSQQPTSGAKSEGVKGTARVLTGSIEDLAASTAVRTGSFTLTWEVGNDYRTQKVPITDGRWECDYNFAEGELVWISEMVVDGSPAFQLAETPLSIQMTRERPVEVVLYKPRQVTLEVVDSQSLQPVRDIEICWDLDGGFVFPPQEVPRKERCSPPETRREGPVALPLIDYGKLYFIRARGYAWQSCVVDHRFAGSRLVCLDPAGTVQLKPPAAGQLIDERHHLWVSLWHESGGARQHITSIELSGSSAPAPIENVPAGDLLIGISSKGRIHDVDGAQRVMHASVAAHATTTVELRGEEELAAQAPPVTLLCELDAPAELFGSDGIPQLLLVDSRIHREYFPAEDTFGAQKKGAGRAKLSPRFDAIPPGDYFLSGNFPPVAIKVHVGAEDTRLAHRIDECGTVRLRPSEGAGPRIDALDWTVYGGDGIGSLPMPAVFDKDTKEWIVRAPIGTVCLGATEANSQTMGQQDVVIAPGETRAELRIVWESRIPIRLRDAGVPVLLSGDWWDSSVVTTAGGTPLPERPIRTTLLESGGNAEIYMGHAGDVIQLPVPPGYVQPGPIRVPDGGFAKDAVVIINLVRRKP